MLRASPLRCPVEIPQTEQNRQQRDSRIKHNENKDTCCRPTRPQIHDPYFHCILLRERIGYLLTESYDPFEHF